MPGLLNPVEEVGGIVLSSPSIGITVKRSSGVEDPILIWDQVTGNVRLQPTTGSASPGTRYIILGATTGVLGHCATGDLAVVNPMGWSRMHQVIGAGTVAFSLRDINSPIAQYDFIIAEKGLEIVDVAANIHIMMVAPGTGVFTFPFALVATAGITSDGVSVGHGPGDAVKRLDNTRVGNGALAANSQGQYNAAFGGGALGANTDGTWNTAIGRFALYSNLVGIYNTAVGANALLNATGSYNASFGTIALQTLHTGDRNTAFGSWAGLVADNVSGLVLLGAFAGRYATVGEALFIDNRDRGSEAAEQTSAILYGKFDPIAANQFLRVNAKFHLGLSQSPTSGGVGIAGQITWDANFGYFCTAANTWKRWALTGGY